MGMNGYIKLIGNEGGYGKKVQVREGMNLGEVFSAEHKYEDSENYTILLNGERACADDELRNGDVVVVTPKNLKGAN